jgi:hypothetical protein
MLLSAGFYGKWAVGFQVNDGGGVEEAGKREGEGVFA